MSLIQEIVRVGTPGPNRVEQILDKAGLKPLPQDLDFAEPPPASLESPLPNHTAEAHDLLVRHRKAKPNYRSPETQKRHLLRVPRQKKAVCDEALWSFTKHEVAVTFDDILSHDPLPPPGVAEAILANASNASVEELWRHLCSPKLDARQKRRSRITATSSLPTFSWLDKVTSLNNTDYVRLICKAGLGQETLDRAFSVALKNYSISVMQLLLIYGACAANDQDTIRDLLRRGNSSLVRVLLRAPENAMSVEAWRYCLSHEVTEYAHQPSSDFMLCLANRPGIVCKPLLIQALQSRNLQVTSALLAYATEESDIKSIGQTACELVSHIEDDEERHNFFTLLVDFALVADGVHVQKELMKDIKTRNLPLVNLFVKTGIRLDSDSSNAAAHIVSRMDLDILELFGGGNIQSPASDLLRFIPQGASEAQLERLIEILAPHGLTGTPLDNLLVRAVHERHVQLVKRLLQMEASVEYRNASAMREAIKSGDFVILNILKSAPCSREILSSTLPTALLLPPGQTRIRFFEEIMLKGVSRESLGICLQMLVAEEDNADLELIYVLLENGAPIDDVGERTANFVVRVARAGNNSLLRLLAKAGLDHNSLSKVVPIIFQGRTVHGYEAACETVEILLAAGATGTPVHETLLAAVTEDRRPELVRILLAHGADANFGNGAAFEVAIKCINLTLLRTLCQSSAPNEASIQSVLYTALDAKYYSMNVLEILLESAKSVGAMLNAAWSSDKLHGNLHLNTIIPCFLEHGLDVNLRDGAPLCLAIQEQNEFILSCLLSSNTNTSSLTAAFSMVIATKRSSFRINCMDLLLRRADHNESQEIGQSRSLLQETWAAHGGDLTGLKLLLRHGADIDHDNGAAVCITSSVGDIRVLEMMFARRPALKTLHQACLACASSTTLSFAQQSLVLNKLLDAREREMTKADNMRLLLADSVMELPTSTLLPMLLITRGVEIPFAVLIIAMETSARELFHFLVSYQDSAAITSLFRVAQETVMSYDRRLWIYEILLSQDVQAHELSRALVRLLEQCQLKDLSIVKLLLFHGAEVGYENAVVFKHALRAKSLEAVLLLSQSLVDDDTACFAFKIVHHDSNLSESARTEIYTYLLQWNISAGLAYQALISHLEKSHRDVGIVRLLLTKGVNIDQDEARCMIIAAKAGEQVIYRALSRNANLSVLVTALMCNMNDESDVLYWFSICLQEQEKPLIIGGDNPIYACMRSFPFGYRLLRVLLIHGASSSTPIEGYIAYQKEKFTPVIWALLDKRNISNEAILTLIRHGGHQASSTFSTARSGTTAPFLCLLDKTRIPILKALIDLDQVDTLNCITPASTFLYFATEGAKFSSSNKEEFEAALPDELPLQIACVMLGNFEAYKALYLDETRNNGTLQLASVLAVPKLIKWLLRYHDPNAELEDYDNMIPLALVCTPKIVPWCKVATQEATLEDRQKECIKLLAPITNVKWRDKSKKTTVLHIALQNSLEIAVTMFEALKVRQDPARNEKYLYQDKDRIQYSLDQYVWRFMRDVSKEKKLRIVQYLLENKIRSRYFKNIMPGEGQQPVGYCGLPPNLDQAWRAHEHSTGSWQQYQNSPVSAMTVPGSWNEGWEGAYYAPSLNYTAPY